MAGYLVAPEFTLVGGARRRPRGFTFIYETGHDRTKCVHSKNDDQNDQWTAYGNKDKTWVMESNHGNPYIQSNDDRRYTNIVVVNESLAIGTDSHGQEHNLICLVDHRMEVPTRRFESNQKMSFDKGSIKRWLETEHDDLNDIERRVVEDFLRSYLKRLEDHEQRTTNATKKWQRRLNRFEEFKDHNFKKLDQYDVRGLYGYTGRETIDAFHKFLEEKVSESEKHAEQVPIVDAHFVLHILHLTQASPAYRTYTVNWYDVVIPCFPGQKFYRLRELIMRKKLLRENRIAELKALHEWFMTVDGLTKRLATGKGKGKGKGLMGRTEPPVRKVT